jgi:hypothetical protein
MLAILLVATIIRILSKGRDNPFVLENPEKSIKKHVKDLENQKIILALIIEANEKYRKHEKRMKAYVNVLNVLTADMTTSREEFHAIFEAMLAGIYHDQEVRVLMRVKGLEYMTEDEFTAIISESIAKRNEMHIKNEKKWIQLDDDFKKSLTNMSGVLNDVVKDSKRLEQAMGTLDKYQTAIHAMISHMATCNYRDNKVLSNYHSTEEELRNTTHVLNVNRRQMYDAFVDLYVHLCTSLSDKEWSAAAKSMKSFF